MQHNAYTSGFFTVLVLLMTGAAPGLAQLDEMSIARELSYSGKYAEADALFNLIVAQEHSTEARIGRAYNHSWHENPERARQDFEEVLASDPTNKDALIGLGYTLAWTGEYEAAKLPFKRAQQLYPGDPEADKGLAYVHLWEHDPNAASQMFAVLSAADPLNPEYYLAQAYAALQNYETRKARILVSHTLTLDPENQGAQALMESIDAATPYADAEIWAGYTDAAGMSATGLRSVRLAVQATRKLRPFLLYDHTLSLDNAGFLLNKQSADTYSAGTTYAWDEHNLSLVQYGYRNYEDAQGGSLLMAEHTHFFEQGFAAKAGGMIGQTVTGDAAWLAYAGGHLPINEKWAVEPTYYLTHPDEGGSMEHRGSVVLQYRARSGFEWNIGGSAGRANSTEADPEPIYGASALIVVPVHRAFWLQGLLRYEDSVPGRFLIASAGVRIRFEK